MQRPALPVTLLWLSALAVAPATAGTDASGFREVAQKPHARYFAAKGAKVDVRRSEAFLERLLSVIGPAPSDWQLEYYRHGSQASLAARVGFAALGVTDLQTSRIDSAFEYHPHEIVHAVAGRLGRPPLLFTEGLAVALTSKGAWHGRDIDAVARGYLAGSGSLYPLVAEFGVADAERDYAVAGSFVAFLLDRYGVQPLVAVFEGCGGDARRYERALLKAYGKGLAGLEQEWTRSLAPGGSSLARQWYDERTWPESLGSPMAAEQRLAQAGGSDSAQPGPATALEYASGGPVRPGLVD